MSTTVYVPRDSSALSLGADKVAVAIAYEAARRNIDLRLVRNGSRGMFWLEPMVEVETARGRVAYGPVTPADVPALFDSGFLDAAESIGWASASTEEIALSQASGAADFRAHRDCRSGLARRLRRARRLSRPCARALAMSAEKIVEEDHRVGIARARRRGLSRRNQMAHRAAGRRAPEIRRLQRRRGRLRHLLRPHDHGGRPVRPDRGHDDRGGLAVGATQGYIYLRSEYPHALRTLNEAIERGPRRGYLGENIAGSAHAFDLEVRLGAGAYICGEETAMLESLEGKRGMVRYKPPVPAIAGLFGQPTIVNNVVSLATVPVILERGARVLQGLRDGSLARHAADSARRQRQASGPGRESLRHHAPRSGLRLRRRHLRADVRCARCRSAVRSAPIFPERMLDLPMDYEAFAAKGVSSATAESWSSTTRSTSPRQARWALEFCAIESCGKCTPCRIGSTRGAEVLDRIIATRDADETASASCCATCAIR